MAGIPAISAPVHLLLVQRPHCFHPHSRARQNQFRRTLGATFRASWWCTELPPVGCTATLHHSAVSARSAIHHLCRWPCALQDLQGQIPAPTIFGHQVLSPPKPCRPRFNCCDCHCSSFHSHCSFQAPRTPPPGQPAPTRPWQLAKWRPPSEGQWNCCSLCPARRSAWTRAAPGKLAPAPRRPLPPQPQALPTTCKLMAHHNLTCPAMRSVFGAGPVVALPGLDSPLAPLPPADAPPVGQSAAEQQPALPGLAAFMGQPGSLEPTLSFLPTMGAPPAPAVGFAMAPPALDGSCYAGGPAAWTGNVTMFPAPAPLADATFPPLPLPQPSGLDKQQVKAQQAQGQPQAQAPAPARSAAGGGERRCRSASVGRRKAAPRARRGRKASTHSDSDDSEALSDLEAEEGDESDREQAAAAAARKERVRAKNRRAQARYRQKQKASGC